jgi:hypothetical protein
MRASVSQIIVNKLASLDLHYPRITGEKEKEIKDAREYLESEDQ